MSDIPKFEPLPNVGNVVSNRVTAFNQGYNLYQCINYLQGYVSIVYENMDVLLDDWNNFKTYINEQIVPLVDDETQEILNQWLTDGTIENIIRDLLGGDPEDLSNRIEALEGNLSNRIEALEGNLSNRIEALEGNLQKPNLLINADFKNGIVNQKGDSSTTSANDLKLTIDGWFLRAKSGKLTVNSNSISLESLENNASDLELYFHQNIKEVNIGEKYTIFANIVDLSVAGKAFICLQDTTGETTEVLELKQGENKLTLTADKNYNKLLIYFDGLKKVEISQLKLEEGENFTGMPNFDYASELEKCKVYLLKLISYADVLSGKSDSSGLVFTIPTTVQMYKDPSQSVKSSIMVFNASGSKQIDTPNLECQVTEIGIRCILRQNIEINGSVNVAFEGNVLFDANR